MCILLKVLKNVLSKYFAFYVFFLILLLLSPLHIVICMRQGGNNDKIVEEGKKKFRREKIKLWTRREIKMKRERGK